jgi:hypothetical protein
VFINVWSAGICKPAGLFLSAYSKLDGNDTVLYIFVVLFLNYLAWHKSVLILLSGTKRFCIVVTDRKIVPFLQ